MPLKPLQLASSAALAVSENKISSGSVIEYEQHSKPILGICTHYNKDKWAILNQHGGELFLPASRLHLLPGKTPQSCASNAQCVEFLGALAEKAEAEASILNLEEVWEVMLGEVEETSVKDLAEMLFGSNDLHPHLVVRRALLNDKIYFKRKKTGYEPRPEDVVAQLKVQAEVEQAKEKRKSDFIAAACLRLRDQSKPLPQPIQALEQLAALGKSAGEAQETRELVDEIIKLSGLSLQGKPEQKAFELLVRMGRFSKDQNLTPLRLGRPLEFSKEVLDAANILAQEPLPKENSRMRLENLYTLTIDGEETKDFDDSLTIERLPDGIKVGIHITDAAAVVKQGSLLEEEAFRRATSIYCPDDYFPMLPPSLSEEKLSLIEATHRQALSFFVQFDRNWEICSRSVHRSLISIDKRLTYEEVDKILCDEPQGTELAESLDLFWQAASAYEHRRLEAGAVQFDRREMFARLTPQGRIVLEPANDETPARKLVAELMILANETAALFAKDKSLPLVFRTQEPPDTELATIETGLPDGPAREYFLRGQLKRSVISTSPASHYGLGIGAYCQVTSPIRRATDLINQRQINHFLDSGEALYSSNDLSLLLATLEQGLEEASLIQRERNRYWLLKYLQQEKIHEIEACIVRIDGPKPLAELDILFALYPFIPLERQISKEALGRKVRLKIERINPHDQTLMLKQIS